MIQKLKIDKQTLGTLAINTAFITLVFLGSYETAYANVFDNLGNAILEILNSTLLRVFAIIAVIIVGLRAFTGRMEWVSAGWVLFGIVVVFGAAGIVDFLIDKTATS